MPCWKEKRKVEWLSSSFSLPSTHSFVLNWFSGIIKPQSIIKQVLYAPVLHTVFLQLRRPPFPGKMMACQLSTSMCLTSALSSMFSPSSLLGSNSSPHQTGHLPHIKPGDFDTSACVASSVSPAGTGILNVGSRKESRQSEFFNIFSTVTKV